MRVVVASGIFPPDIGGPATHAADLARALRDRGHRVTVLSLTDGERAADDPGLVLHPRRWPWPVRTAAATAWLLRHRAEYEVVYASGLDLPAVAGARLARRPVVLKVPGDRAWERGRRQGLTRAGFEEFQANPGGPLRLRAMRVARNWTVRRATAVVVPSRYLEAVVRDWSGGRSPVTVVPNGVRRRETVEADGVEADGVEAGAGGEPRLRLLYVGRLVAHKRVEVLLEALARSHPSITLDVVGDGPERAHIEDMCRSLALDRRVRLLGTLDHDDVMRHMAGADALVSATAYEGLPHTVIESLVCGTPVVTTPAGGVVEAVADGINGLLVARADPHAFAAAFEELRIRADLRERLSAGAEATGRAWDLDRTAERLEALLQSIAGPRPRAVYVGRGALRWPPGDSHRRKLAIHARHLRQLSIGTGPPGLRRIEGTRALFLPPLPSRAAGAALFYAIAPVVAVAAAAGRRPGVVVCQSPYEGVGAALAVRLLPRPLRPLVQVELHGDWRTAARMYGSPARRLLAPLADRAAEWALRRADRVRAVSTVLEGLARQTGFRGPVDRHITYSEFDVFLDSPPVPLPQRPVAAFVGVLERYKAVDVLLDAWPSVVERVPSAELVVVGKGRLGDALQRRLRAERIPSVRTLDPVPQPELAALLDRSTCLVLPSRSEGLPRIVLEAMARGRSVVASDVGGMRELVDRATGRVVPAEDVVALAEALVEVLGDRDLAEAMGRAARAAAERRQPLAEYEAGIARLAGWAASVGPARARTTGGGRSANAVRSR